MPERPQSWVRSHLIPPRHGIQPRFPLQVPLWTDPCLGQTLVFCSFLCLNYLNIPHLYFMCLAPLLFLCVQIISPSGKKKNKLFFYRLGLCPPNAPILLDLLPFFYLLIFLFFFKRDHYYGSSIRTSFFSVLTRCQ